MKHYCAKPTVRLQTIQPIHVLCFVVVSWCCAQALQASVVQA